MAFFSKIDECNRRRFISPNNEILAIYDQAKSYTLYAQVGAHDDSQICFVSEPRVYWPDEITELPTKSNSSHKAQPFEDPMTANTFPETDVAGRVRLGNKRAGAAAKPKPGEIAIDIDRANPVLGNPYVLKDHRDDVRRAEVIRLYGEKYQHDIARHGPMAIATEDLAQKVQDGKRLILMCWCAGPPFNKPCHGDLIITEIRRLLTFKCE